MSHTISIQSHIFSKDDILSQRTEFKLPLTEIYNASDVLHPNTFNFCIAENYFETIDISALGGKLRLLSVKSTRPIEIVLTDVNDVETKSPYVTFYQLLFDSKEETYIPLVDKITFNVPLASVVSPVPPPSKYPRAIVQVFALVEDIVPYLP